MDSLRGDIVRNPEESRAENVLLLKGKHWALYRRQNDKYLRNQSLSDFVFVDKVRGLTAVVDCENVTLIPDRKCCPGPPGSWIQLYNTPGLFQGGQLVAGANNPGSNFQFNHLGNSTSDITFNGVDTLTFSRSGVYDASYNMIYTANLFDSQTSYNTSVRLLQTRNGITSTVPGSVAASTFYPYLPFTLVGNVKFSIQAGDSLQLANNNTAPIQLYPPPYVETSAQTMTNSLEFLANSVNDPVFVSIQVVGDVVLSVEINSTPCTLVTSAFGNELDSEIWTGRIISQNTVVTVTTGPNATQLSFQAIEFSELSGVPGNVGISTTGTVSGTQTISNDISISTGNNFSIGLLSVALNGSGKFNPHFLEETSSELSGAAVLQTIRPGTTSISTQVTSQTSGDLYYSACSVELLTLGPYQLTDLDPINNLSLDLFYLGPL